MYKNKKQIENEIIEAERTYDFQEGFKLLYVPWKTILTSKIAFISLNPGKPPKNADLRVISDERGNSYEVEEFTTESPLTPQFLKLSKFLKVPPRLILTGAFCPFRGAKWKHFSKEKKNIGFEIGKKFWFPVIRKNNIKLIITLGHGKELLNTLTKPIVDEFNAKIEKEIILGNNWCSMRRYKSKNLTVIQLPHLSQFKIFNKDNSYLKEIEEIFSETI